MLNLLRRFEAIIVDSPESAWLKEETGQFVLISPGFADRLQVPPDGYQHGVVDEDLFEADEVARFRRDDRRVIAAQRPDVFLEPPDSVSNGRWCATLKIPIEGDHGKPVALAFSHSLDLLEPLIELASGGRTRSSGDDQRIADRMRDLLDELFYGRLRMPSLARALDRHPDYLARVFRNAYGVRINQYLMARRVAAAVHRIGTTDRPLAEIAVACGFYDQSHLTRSFRALLGDTPARYRDGAHRSARRLESARLGLGAVHHSG